MLINHQEAPGVKVTFRSSPDLETSTKVNWDQRYFWTSEGWFYRLREKDQENVDKKMLRRVDGERIVGPFRSKHYMMEWVTGFFETFTDKRHRPKMITDEMVSKWGKRF